MSDAAEQLEEDRAAWESNASLLRRVRALVAPHARPGEHLLETLERLLPRPAIALCDSIVVGGLDVASAPPAGAIIDPAAVVDRILVEYEDAFAPKKP